MPKTIGTNLKNHLAGEVTTLATLWKLTRADATVMGFTDHDKDISYLGVTYEAASGYLPTALLQTGNLAVDNLEATAFLESDRVTEQDLLAGLYDFANLDIYLVNYKDLTMGHMILAGGWILGEVSIKEHEFTAEVSSKAQKLQQNIIELYSPDCRVKELGDTRCKLPVNPDLWAADTVYAIGDAVQASVFDGNYYECTTAGTSDSSEPTWDTTVGNTTVEGPDTLVWTCRLGWRVQGVVTSVGTDTKRVFTDSGRSEAVDWFKYGKFTWLTGNNAGYSQEIKGFDTGEFTTFERFPYAVVIGDTYEVEVGCDRAMDTCITKFDNILNFRGEPYVPGIDEVVKVGSTPGV